MRQEYQVGSLDDCTTELQQQAYAQEQRLASQDAQRLQKFTSQLQEMQEQMNSMNE